MIINPKFLKSDRRIPITISKFTPIFPKLSFNWPSHQKKKKLGRGGKEGENQSLNPPLN